MVSCDSARRRPLLVAFSSFCAISLVVSVLVIFPDFQNVMNSRVLQKYRSTNVLNYGYVYPVTITRSPPHLTNMKIKTTKTQPKYRMKSILIDDFFIPRNTTFNGVTRIIHQSWKSKRLPSKRMERWSKSWKTCYPNWTYKLWTDEDNRNFIKTFYPWFLQRYDSFPQTIMRVDAVRYFYMLHYGGIYADLDTECLRPFEHLLNASIVLGAMEGHWVDGSDIGHIQNSFMYSEPGNSYWLEAIMGIYNRGKLGGVEDSTGPLLMMRILSKYKKRGIKNVMVYPGTYFNPFSWIRNPNPKYCRVQGGMNDEQLQKCKETFKDSYVVQYHTKTWAGGRA